VISQKNGKTAKRMKIDLYCGITNYRIGPRRPGSDHIDSQKGQGRETSFTV